MINERNLGSSIDRWLDDVPSDPKPEPCAVCGSQKYSDSYELNDEIICSKCYRKLKVRADKIVAVVNLLADDEYVYELLKEQL